jgi:hypothetical protein
VHILQKPTHKVAVLWISVSKDYVVFLVLKLHTHLDVKPFCGLLNRLSPPAVSSRKMSDDVPVLLSCDKGSNKDTLPLSATPTAAAVADVPRLNKQKNKTFTLRRKTRYN